MTEWRHVVRPATLAQVVGDIPDVHVIAVRERRVTVDYPTIIQNNVNTDTIELDLDGEWDGMSVVLVLGPCGGATELAWHGEPLTLPSALAEDTGGIDVSVVGYSSDGETRLVTVAAPSLLNVIKSGCTVGEEPGDETPDLIGQLVAAGDAANKAAQAANTAAKAANDAAASATSAASAADTAKQNADAATTAANNAASAANTAKQNADAATSNANVAASAANTAASSANAAAAAANGAAEDATVAAQNALNIVNSIASIEPPSDDEVQELREENATLATALVELQDGYIVLGETAYMPTNRRTALSSETVTVAQANVSGETATLS